MDKTEPEARRIEVQYLQFVRCHDDISAAYKLLAINRVVAACSAIQDAEKAEADREARVS